MTEGALQFLCVVVGGRWFAFDIRVVREILPPRPLVPVPGAPPELRGVFNLRGELVPVADLHRILGEAGPPEEGEEAKLLVVRCRGRTFAVGVDRLGEVETVPPEGLEPIPGVEDPARGLVVAMFRRRAAADDVVLVIRAGAVLPDPVDEEVIHGAL
ncbi:MAG: chemotaxis protein CheW [Candidatus Dadabacteria bacterium]|nr:MAG: chemotaxis protein CheW [Candidatus Dadabacteria bacterium]